VLVHQPRRLCVLCKEPVSSPTFGGLVWPGMAARVAIRTMVPHASRLRHPATLRALPLLTPRPQACPFHTHVSARPTQGVGVPLRSRGDVGVSRRLAVRASTSTPVRPVSTRTDLPGSLVATRAVRPPIWHMSVASHPYPIPGWFRADSPGGYGSHLLDLVPPEPSADAAGGGKHWVTSHRGTCWESSSSDAEGSMRWAGGGRVATGRGGNEVRGVLRGRAAPATSAGTALRLLQAVPLTAGSDRVSCAASPPTVDVKSPLRTPPPLPLPLHIPSSPALVRCVGGTGLI
jgi:hypothetical protein